MTPAGYCT
ncbi:hypothetical protein E2C01_035903 [Portunus trituberculatus]|uniref:Uncharacterized protein n=1 Tax=Portunus trituberculatus TaxID=210409 RepID=A0A5B7FCQ8_PORTR|nr:hypothetical protein [Portunus trituberculatus]